MLQALSTTSPSEVLQLLPTHTRRPAYLLRRVSFTDRHQAAGGMASWSFRRLPLPAGSTEASDRLGVDSVLFEETDWTRNATAIISNLPDVLARKYFVSRDSQRTLPKPELDVLATPAAQISECSRLSFVMLDALAAGERAIFGRESFTDEIEFFRACGNLLAMLPAFLRGHASFAAGFTRPVAGALIQWIDGHVLPSKEGVLTAELVGRGAGLTTEEVSRRFRAPSFADNIVGPPGSSHPEQEARSRFARVLAGDAQCPEAATCAMADDESAIAPATIQSTASLVEALFASAPASESLLARSRAGRYLMTLQRGHSLPTSDAAAMEDSIDAVEQTLAAIKRLADRLGWTSGLEALSKAAITALRKLTIEKSDADIGINSSLLRAIARAPHCRRVVARLIALGDQAVTEGIEQACAVAKTISRQLRLARDKLAYELFLVEPSMRSVLTPAWREISIATVRLSLPPSPDTAFRVRADGTTPTPSMRSRPSTTSPPASRTY